MRIIILSVFTSLLFSGVVKSQTNSLSFFPDKGIFKIENSPFNTAESEFVSSYFGKKQIIIISGKKKKFFKTRFGKKQNTPETVNISDIKRGKIQNIKPVKKGFFKKASEISVSINDKKSFSAFALKPFDKHKSGENKHSKILFSYIKDDIFQDPLPFKFNNETYSVTTPCLSDDGNTMYFASDMPGGYGGFDIYVTKKDFYGDWTQPVNLGKTINTEGNETFPFMHKNGILFFASDKHPGMGGYDIFMTKKDNKQYIKPVNLGMPVNSEYNDFAFIADDKIKHGFFASDRETGKGNTDIYRVKILKKIQFDIKITGKVTDTENKPLPGTFITIYDDRENPLKTAETDINGNYVFSVPPEKTYTVKAEKPKYIPSSVKTETKSDKTTFITDLKLEKMSDFVIRIFIKDYKTKDFIQNPEIIVTDNFTNAKKKINFSEKGSFYLKLPDKKLYDTVNFSFIFKKEGYAPATYNFKQVLTRLGEYNFTVNMKKLKPGEDLGKLIELNPIYFDFDKYDIRPDAAAELDKIVKIMNEYPKMEIELSSHTDCRGSAIYNMKLSDKRAKASADYIKKRITNPVRISGRGYGESKPVNNCNCNGNGIKCSEEQHQQNRRTEFKIIRI